MLLEGGSTHSIVLLFLFLHLYEKIIAYLNSSERLLQIHIKKLKPVIQSVH